MVGTMMNPFFKYSTVAALCVATTSLPAHARKPEIAPQQSLENSLKSFNALLKKSKGNYSYEVTTSSMTGARTKTTIVVADYKISERRYETFAPQPDAEPKLVYLEKGDKIGTNKQGAPAKTITALHAQAKEVLAKPKAPHEKLYLYFNSDGVLKSCFTIDTRIACDVPHKGVRISKIIWP